MSSLRCHIGTLGGITLSAGILEGPGSHSQRDWPAAKGPCRRVQSEVSTLEEKGIATIKLHERLRKLLQIGKLSVGSTTESEPVRAFVC